MGRYGLPSTLTVDNVERNSGMLQTRASNATNQSENTEKPKTFTFSGTLNSLGTIDRLPEFRFRWNTNEVLLTEKPFVNCNFPSFLDVEK